MIGAVAASYVDAIAQYSTLVGGKSGVFYLPMSETAGATARDLKASRNFTIANIASLGNPTVRPGGAGSYSFVPNDWLTRASEAAMNTADFSLVAWIKPSGSSFDCIASRDSTSGVNRGWSLYLASGRVTVYGASTLLQGASSLANDVVRMVTLTYKASTTTLKVYVDDVLDGTATVAVNNTFGHEFVIGTSHAGSAGYEFGYNGLMNSVSFHGTELSAADVAEIYSARAALDPPITLVGTARTSGGTNAVMTLPAGIAVGDLLVVMMVSDGTISVPAGWTDVAYANPGGWFRGRVMFKVATSGDVTAGTMTSSTGGTSTAVISAWRGATSAALVYHSAVGSPGDTGDAVAVPSGAGVLLYLAGLRGPGGTITATAAIDRGTMRHAANTGGWHYARFHTEDAGAAVTVNITKSGTVDGTYYSVVRVT